MDNDKAPTLTEFLLARISEREAVARAAVERNGAHWSTEELDEGTRINGTVDRGNPRAYPDSPELWDDEGALGMFPETAAHIAFHDPARVLAECAAMRLLIADLNSERHEVVDQDCWYTCSAATEERDGGETCDDSRRHGECDCGRDTRVSRRLGILAAVDADHEDYLEKWKP